MAKFYKCDRCGKEMPACEVNYDATIHDYTSDKQISYDFDFCKSCFDLIDAMFKEEIK